MTAMNDSTAQLFAMFSDQLLQASDLDEGRFAEFSKIANMYGTHADVILYRDVTEEQRQTVDTFMQQHPNRDSYKAIINSLHGEHDGTAKGVFDLLVLIYDDISSVVGPEGERFIQETILAMPEECLSLRGQEMDVMKAAIALTIYCVVDSRTPQPSKYAYLTNSLSPNTATNPQVHAGSGLLLSLRPEYPWLIETYPEKAMEIVHAAKASPRKLKFSELELVAAGEQPVALVEGML
jgi:hypothetical protein